MHGQASAIVNVNPRVAAAALAQARMCGLDVGLHLNVTEGAPVAAPESIASLLVPETDGRLVFRGKLGFRDALDRGDIDLEIDLEQLVIECVAQMHWFTAHNAGVAPTHCDGHQHFHVCPGGMQREGVHVCLCVCLCLSAWPCLCVCVCK